MTSGSAAAWHVDRALLAAYLGGRLDTGRAWSVEAHLPACADCRRAVAAQADPARLVRAWSAVVDTIDRPRAGPVELALRRLGVPDDTARVLAATPSLRLSWLLAVALALAFALAAALAADAMAVAAGEARPVPLLFLTVAPLLPLAGVAAAYGPGVDPAFEIALAAPVHSFRLLLLRSAAVLTATVGLALPAGLLLPAGGRLAAAWLLPALCLTTASLALAPRVAPARAASALAVLWVAGVVAGLRQGGDSALFDRGWQVAFVLLALLAGAAVWAQRHSFDQRRR